MNKEACIKMLLGKKKSPVKKEATASAPTNIALIKYWGKRDEELNLPRTSSLSRSLTTKTTTAVSVTESKDTIFLNDKNVAIDSLFYKRVISFLDLFRPKDLYFEVKTTNDLPTTAGLATSASGFAALTIALNDLFGWGLDKKELSIIARLGSGSASRSLFDGFVIWHKGSQKDGLDSYSEKLAIDWPELLIGAIVVSKKEKPIDSRAAMKQTIETSILYSSWEKQVTHDLQEIQKALFDKDFSLLGKISEHNALSMHATMLAASPAICYMQPETIETMQKIWALRKKGIECYLTMDAGPNIKLLFQKKDLGSIKQSFPEIVMLLN